MKEKVWKYQTRSLVEWIPTHGSRMPVKGIVITTLPRIENGLSNPTRWNSARGLASLTREVISRAACEDRVWVNVHGLGTDFFANKLDKLYKATCQDRYLIWLPEIREFRTPGKSIVEKGVPASDSQAHKLYWDQICGKNSIGPQEGCKEGQVNGGESTGA